MQLLSTSWVCSCYLRLGCAVVIYILAVQLLSASWLCSCNLHLGCAVTIYILALQLLSTSWLCSCYLHLGCAVVIYILAVQLLWLSSCYLRLGSAVICVLALQLSPSFTSPTKYGCKARRAAPVNYHYSLGIVWLPAVTGAFSEKVQLNIVITIIYIWCDFCCCECDCHVLSLPYDISVPGATKSLITFGV